MGQQEVSTSNNTTIKVTQLLKITSDGANWLTYHERVLNAATAWGLCRHLVGTALKPSTIIEKNRKFYLKDDDPDPLSKEALDKHETSVNSWEQKEAQVHELIYNTVDNATFLQIKREKTATALWKKLTSIHGNKGAQFKEYLLGKLQTARYMENEDMRWYDCWAAAPVFALFPQFCQYRMQCWAYYKHYSIGTAGTNGYLRVSKYHWTAFGHDHRNSLFEGLTMTWHNLSFLIG